MESYEPRAATEDPTTNDEDKALKILADTCRKTNDGRFETGLLWKSTEELPNNHIYAENHLKSLQRKLKEDDDLAQLNRKKDRKTWTRNTSKESTENKRKTTPSGFYHTIE